MAFILCTGVTVLVDITETLGIRGLNASVFVSSLTFALLLCLSELTQTSGNPHERFQTLSGEELLEVWHTDCHHRCNNELFQQVNLACRFDPYKIIYKRSVNATHRHFQNTPPPQPSTTTEPSPFITKDVSAGFLNKYKYKRHGHSISKRGILDECCLTKPCSWEEYAEYCHTDHRRRTDLVNRCIP